MRFFKKQQGGFSRFLHPGAQILTLALFLTACFPRECPECFAEDQINYQFDFIAIPELASNQVMSLSASSDGQSLLIATNGGGVAQFFGENSENIVYKTTDIASNQTYKAVGGSSVLFSSVTASSNTATLNGYDGDSFYTPHTSGAGKFIDLSYNGSDFFALEDNRLDSNLSKNAVPVQSKIHLFTAVNTTPDVSKDIDFATSTVGALSGQALVRILTDRDGDLVGAGYGWVNTDTRLAIYRLKKADLALKIFNSSNINPIVFGFAREVPTALTYENLSVGAYIYEKIYIATDKALYILPIENYRFVLEVNRYYFDGSSWVKGSGNSTISVSDLHVFQGNLYIASNHGLHILRSDFETLTEENSTLPTNTINAISSMNGHVYLGLNGGVIKITEITNQ